MTIDATEHWASDIDAMLQKLGHADAEKNKNLLGNLNVWLGASKTNPEIIAISKKLAEIFQLYGAKISEPVTGHVGDALVMERLGESDLITMLAATPGVSAEALEICSGGDKTNADKMVVYMPDEYRNGYIYNTLVQKYKAKVKTFELAAQPAANSPSLCMKMFCDAMEVANAKVTNERLRPKFAPRIGIITALPVEQQAVQRVLRDPLPQSSRVKKLREYLHGSIGEHKVVLSLAGKGNNKAAILATEMLNDFDSIEEIFMVGIAAGVPTPKKAATDVRLGDVVVSDEFGVVQYDMVKQQTRKTEYVPPPRPPDADWTKRLKNYLAGMPREPAYWQYLDEICTALEISRPTRGPLCDCPWAEGASAIRRQKDHQRTKDRPRLFEGAIASANTVLKSASVRNRLRDKFSVKAVEMEGSGIADATWEAGKGYLIVRGICDYANDGKNKTWQPYAAAAAAAFARDLIESMPVKSGAVGEWRSISEQRH